MEADEHAVDVRHGPEHLARHRAGEPPRTVPRGLHARGAVHLRPGWSGEPLAHFCLHHDDAALDRGERLHEVQQHGDAHVVRQVRDEHVGVARKLRDAQGVGVDDRERAGGNAVRGGRRGQTLREPVVDLDRRRRRPGLEDREGQRSEARPDLDHTVAGRHGCHVHDLADGVRIDDEVLPELLGRGDVELGGEGADLGGAEEGHGHGVQPIRGRPRPHRGLSRPRRARPRGARPRSGRSRRRRAPP